MLNWNVMRKSAVLRVHFSKGGPNPPTMDIQSLYRLYGGVWNNIQRKVPTFGMGPPTPGADQRKK